MEILQRIGLTNSEVQVYLALLELGCVSTGKIVDKSNTASSKIYEILDKLMQKGLVSYVIKSGVKHYEAAPVKRIMDYMEEKQKQIINQKKELENLLPSLQIKQNLAKHKSEATIYKGIKGIKTAFYDSLNLLKKGDEILVLGVPPRSDTINRLFIKFNKLRAEEGIKQRILINESARFDEKNLLKNNKLTKMRYISQFTPTTIKIFNDRILIFPKAKDLLLISIDNKEVAKSFKVQFELLWNQEVKTYSGQEQVEKCYNNLLQSISKKDEIVVFAAKPITKIGADFNIEFNKQVINKAKNYKLMYYGENKVNLSRAKEVEKLGCQTKIIPTNQTLPISTIIHKDTVLNSVWAKNPITFAIQNKTVADSFKENFKLLWNQKVQTYEGKKQIQDLFVKMLTFGDYYTFAEGNKIVDLLGKKFFVWWQQQKLKKNITSKGIIGSKYKKDVTVTSSITKFKFLPGYEAPGVTIIFKEKIVIIMFSKKPLAFLIENKEVAQTNKIYFELLWNQDTHVVEGVKAIEDLFEELLTAKEVCFIGARGYFADEREKYFDMWQKKALISGLKIRNVVDPKTKGHKITALPFAKTKYTLPQEFSKLSVFWIFSNKVVISNWVNKKPFAIIINKKEVYDLYKSQFELLWNQDVSTDKGLTDMHAAWDVMLDELNPGEEFYVLGASWHGQKTTVPEYFKDFHKRRIKKKIKVKFLFAANTNNHIKKHKKSYDPLSEIKFLPKGIYEGMQINLYKGKVLMFVWREKPIVFKIDDETVFRTFKSYFDTLWKQSKKFI